MTVIMRRVIKDTLVNVYVTLPVFTHIAGTPQSRCGRFFHFCWC